VRYYLGVDWADQTHAVWVVDETGSKLTACAVAHTAEGLGEWGRELDTWRAKGIELWAAIERPDGRVVDFLLDHGVVVYPVNPKALDRPQPPPLPRGRPMARGCRPSRSPAPGLFRPSKEHGSSSSESDAVLAKDRRAEGGAPPAAARHAPGSGRRPGRLRAHSVYFAALAWRSR
jgi:hypothetical protein